MKRFLREQLIDPLKRLFSMQRNNKEPLALSKMAFVIYGLVVMFLVGIAFPLQENIFRAFLANLTQELVIAEVNPARHDIENLGPLKPHPKLTQAAQMKAEDMIERDYFSHNSPEGERPWTWLNKVNYKYALAGENLAIDYNDPYLVTRAWLNSPSHRRNILNGHYTDIGIGVAEGEYQGRDTVIVVMFLGKEISPTLEGLAAQDISSKPKSPATPTPNIEDVPTISNIQNIRDGDLIKAKESPDVYIAKVSGGRYYKRLILNPNIFDSYSHLTWDNVKTVDLAVLENMQPSQMVMEVDQNGKPVNGNIYVLSSAKGSDLGTKHHLRLSAEEFNSFGYEWDAVYKINHKEASNLFYPEGAAITAETLPTFALIPEFRALLVEDARFAAVAGAYEDAKEMAKIQLVKDEYLSEESRIIASVANYVADAASEPSKFWSDVKIFFLDMLPEITRKTLATFFIGLLGWLLLISLVHEHKILYFAPRAFLLGMFAAVLLI